MTSTTTPRTPRKSGGSDAASTLWRVGRRAFRSGSRPFPQTATKRGLQDISQRAAVSKREHRRQAELRRLRRPAFRVRDVAELARQTDLAEGRQRASGVVAEGHPA